MEVSEIHNHVLKYFCSMLTVREFSTLDQSLHQTGRDLARARVLQPGPTQAPGQNVLLPPTAILLERSALHQLSFAN